MRTPAGVIAGWRRDGAGPTAVLLHGGPGLSDNVADLADLLGGVFTTIRYQQRGLPPTTLGEPYTVDAHVDDATAVIDQTAGGRCWIVGFSWGGHLALHLLVACPERVAGAVIIDPLGAFVEAMDAFSENLPARLSSQDGERLAAIEDREARGEATADELLEAEQLLWRGYFANPATAPPRPSMQSNPRCAADTVASIREHGERGTLAKGLGSVPRLPVLFIHGADSPMPVTTTTDTAALIPGARVDVLDHAGHYVFLEQPQRVRSAIESFVALRSADPG